MSEAQMIWRLGRWIGQKIPGVVRLRHQNGELCLRVRDGQIVAAEGIDGDAAGAALGAPCPPETDILAAARNHATSHGMPETEAVGIAKRLIQNELRAWLEDNDRSIEMEDEAPAARKGHAISATHAIVELLLSEPSGELTARVLPDPNVLLRRSEGFLELYVPLGLSEEADLIVAKITGQRTAAEIIARSPQPDDEVSRLLAALTATGMLEPVAVPETTPEHDHRTELDSPYVTEQPVERRRLAPGLILVAALCLALAATAVWWFAVRDRGETEEPAGQTGRWGIVIDLGCEPHEYRRLLEVAQRHRDVQAIAVSEIGGEAEGCWRLVWGSFPSPDSAREAIATIPQPLRRDGFDPHPVEIPDPGSEPSIGD